MQQGLVIHVKCIYCNKITLILIFIVCVYGSYKPPFTLILVLMRFGWHIEICVGVGGSGGGLKKKVGHKVV